MLDFYRTIVDALLKGVVGPCDTSMFLLTFLSGF